MKKKLIFSASLLFLSQFLFAETAKFKEMKSTLSLKNKEGKIIELTEKDIKEKQTEIKIRPSKQINKVVLENTYEIILKNDANEFVFETYQKRDKVDSNETDPSKPEANMKIKYLGKAEQNNQSFNVNCFELATDVDGSAKTEETKTIECIKKENCQSYAVKNTSTFEIKATPICIGTQETKVVAKKVDLKLACWIYNDAKDKYLILSQVLGQRDISEVKSKEKCQ